MNAGLTEGLWKGHDRVHIRKSFLQRQSIFLQREATFLQRESQFLQRQPHFLQPRHI